MIWGWGQQGQTTCGSARRVGEGGGPVPTHPAPPRVLSLLVWADGGLTLCPHRATLLPSCTQGGVSEGFSDIP